MALGFWDFNFRVALVDWGRFNFRVLFLSKGNDDGWPMGMMRNGKLGGFFSLHGSLVLGNF
jgi:hypothetical protein